ncbi:MAG: HPP family protein [Candidatus Thermoplasmatota archaeon]|nr:HPP family protein [Candidatus Thermoplasmatota archaeon]
MNELKEDDAPLSDKIKDYVIYLIIFAVIVSLITIRGNYILAPPYAVSAYLVVFQRNTKYSSRKSLMSTYLLVIITSDIIHLALGAALDGLILNVIIISAFITFTELSHPPAIALAIFSYIAGDPLDFTISSFLALAALLASSLILDRYAATKGK